MPEKDSEAFLNCKMPKDILDDIRVTWDCSSVNLQYENYSRWEHVKYNGNDRLHQMINLLKDAAMLLGDYEENSGQAEIWLQRFQKLGIEF